MPWRWRRNSELLIYVQLQRREDVESACRIVDDAGFYGTRIFVEKGSLTRLHLADNLADVLIAVGKTASKISETEALRVLRPQAKALLGRKVLTKPFPKGVDDWSHPHHGPDNNPQSEDRVIVEPYLTQFLAEPRYAPMPQVAVASLFTGPSREKELEHDSRQARETLEQAVQFVDACKKITG